MRDRQSEKDSQTYKVMARQKLPSSERDEEQIKQKEEITTREDCHEQARVAGILGEFPVLAEL